MAPTQATKPTSAQAHSFLSSRAAMSTANSLSAPRALCASLNPSTFQSSTEPICYTTSIQDLEDRMTGLEHGRPEHSLAERRPISTSQEQSGQIASDLTRLESVRRKQFQTAGLRLRASKNTYDNLNARFLAADEDFTKVLHPITARSHEEQGLMLSLMADEISAKAESTELFAKRLRESVTRIDPLRSRLELEILRLTATSDAAEQDGHGAFELDSGDSAEGFLHASSVSDDIIHPDMQSPRIYPAPTGQHFLQEVPSVVEDKQAEQTTPIGTSQWQPHAIAQLPPLEIKSQNNETFAWEQLHNNLGGTQYPPGLYLSHSNPASPSGVLPNRTYWLLEAQCEPFAPTRPGQHGAKLTAFFNDSLSPDGTALDEEDYVDVPVFVRLHEGHGYSYLGQYSQKRYSDRVSHSELFQHVPTCVLQYWAGQLACPYRPAWITEALIAHFWPQPDYTGPIPSDSVATTPRTDVTEVQDVERGVEKRVVRALESYALELRDWKKEAQLRATLLTEEALMEMWEKSDMDDEKGLRLWWGYLECVGFEETFYKELVALKKREAKATVQVAVAHGWMEKAGDHDGEGPRRHPDVKSQGQKDSESRHKAFTFPSSSAASISTVKPVRKAETLIRSARPADISLQTPAFTQGKLRAARGLHDEAKKGRDCESDGSDEPRA